MGRQPSSFPDFWDSALTISLLCLFPRMVYCIYYNIAGLFLFLFFQCLTSSFEGQAVVKSHLLFHPLPQALGPKACATDTWFIFIISLHPYLVYTGFRTARTTYRDLNSKRNKQTKILFACSLNCPQTCSSSVSASSVLELQIFTTIPWQLKA